MPVEGQLIAHSQDAEVLWGEIAERQGQFYVFYTGEILKEMGAQLLQQRMAQAGLTPNELSRSLIEARAATTRITDCTEQH